MSTPCQLDPDKWTSDDQADRNLAKRRCFDCPAESFIACAARASHENPDLGVWAGKDFTRTKEGKPKTGEPTHCGHCGRPITQNSSGRRKTYCGQGCAYLAKRARAAA